MHKDGLSLKLAVTDSAVNLIISDANF